MNPVPRVGAAILAGGMGVRAGSGPPKPFKQVAGQPLLVHSLKTLDAMEEVSLIRVAVPGRYANSWDAVAESYAFRKYRGRVEGGLTRSQSALAVLRAMEADGVDLVLIHDAARPLVSREEVARLIETAGPGTGAILAARTTDTLWRVSPNNLLLETVDRNTVIRALTPQAFPYGAILDAYERGAAEGFEGTDDASYALRAGLSVAWIPGTSKNIKATYPEDFLLLEALLKERS